MKKATIMVVEDHAITAEDIEKRIKRMGYDVSSVVSSGEEAIKKAEEDKPDLVLMDIKLQKDKMDGIEAASQIRSRFNIPVIYLTAYSDERTLERAKITEPYGYITKPFNDREIHSNIEIALYKHNAEQELNKQREELNKQREKFISVLIHDINNPLLLIINYIKRLIAGKAKSEEDRIEHLNTALKAAQDLEKIIKITSMDLRNKTVLESFHPNYVDISEILTSVATNFTPDAEEKGIKIFINNRGKENWKELEKIVFKADSYQLKTLIENLLGNAIKYAKNSIKIELYQKDSDICFVISDDGPGIPEEYHEKIFEEYFQVPGSKKGTGFGLYSGKKIVDNHKGKIIVNSSLNRGSSFEITL